ncbi:MAG: DUF393 domain-containing protein, partial [Thiotrichaceae bacterium]|nr:DUF393 domain-containing protein [Thiotrichaceae bacterium]
YYISALDVSWLLNIKPLQMLIGYSILIFQFLFVFLVFYRRFRVILLVIGSALHLGITLTLNIYPFGIGMLIFYVLLVPFAWWRKIALLTTKHPPVLTIFYNPNCPDCLRSVIKIRHFDIFQRMDYKTINDPANFPPGNIASREYDTNPPHIFAVSPTQRIYSGFDALVRILIKMLYSAPLGLIFSIPGIYHMAKIKYLKHSVNHPPPLTVVTEKPITNHATCNLTLYDRLFDSFTNAPPAKTLNLLAKTLIIIFFLQLNSTLHYGIAYRLKLETNNYLPFNPISGVSNALIVLSHTFIGITPHALYLHDHFDGFDHVLGITYLDSKNQEHWLPFINDQGRLIAPNWGRVQSMWANVAVTSNIDNAKLDKYIMKITAFWGTKIGLDLNNATFHIMLKSITTPTTWMYNLRKNNLANGWKKIGSAQWNKHQITVNLPDNIEQI